MFATVFVEVWDDLEGMGSGQGCIWPMGGLRPPHVSMNLWAGQGLDMSRPLGGIWFAEPVEVQGLAVGPKGTSGEATSQAGASSASSAVSPVVEENSVLVLSRGNLPSDYAAAVLGLYI